MSNRRRRDRPQNPSNRIWLVKMKGFPDPVEVEAEYRSMARHYAKCLLAEAWKYPSQEHYRLVQWARLKCRERKQ